MMKAHCDSFSFLFKVTSECGGLDRIRQSERETLVAEIVKKERKEKSVD